MNMNRLRELRNMIIERDAHKSPQELLNSPPTVVLSDSEKAEYLQLMDEVADTVERVFERWEHGLLDALGVVDALASI